MSDKYSDRLQRLQVRVQTWYDHFQNSPDFQLLNASEQAEANAVITFFADYSYSHLGVRPEGWDGASVEECCTEILPAKISGQLVFFEAVAPVLTAFFNFLGDQSLLAQGHTLAETAATLHHDIIANSRDASRWGPAKTFVMRALEEGVNVHDSEALEAYCVKANEELAHQHAAPLSASGWAPPVSVPLPEQRVHAHPSIGRYDPCPCGSGKKFKFCCETRLRDAR